MSSKIKSKAEFSTSRKSNQKLIFYLPAIKLKVKSTKAKDNNRFMSHQHAKNNNDHHL